MNGAYLRWIWELCWIIFILFYFFENLIAFVSLTAPNWTQNSESDSNNAKKDFKRWTFVWHSNILTGLVHLPGTEWFVSWIWNLKALKASFKSYTIFIQLRNLRCDVNSSTAKKIADKNSFLKWSKEINYFISIGLISIFHYDTCFGFIIISSNKNKKQCTTCLYANHWFGINSVWFTNGLEGREH